MLNRYQTGPLTTFVVLIVMASLFVLGLVRIVHFHRQFGWLDCLMNAFLLFTFHQRYRQDAGSLNRPETNE